MRLESLTFDVRNRSAGNINAIKQLIKCVRQHPERTDLVATLCDAAMAMRGEIEDHRHRENDRLAKERDKAFYQWAEEQGRLASKGSWVTGPRLPGLE